MRRTAGMGYLNASSQAWNVFGSGASAVKEAMAVCSLVQSARTLKEEDYLESFDIEIQA